MTPTTTKERDARWGADFTLNTILYSLADLINNIAECGLPHEKVAIAQHDVRMMIQRLEALKKEIREEDENEQ